ncbi:protein lifeguard 2-like [Ischnura elegans]|uniref:protein lifeguard 2-like n=1 Tax=Ischnura elegans TaxID=197161 RepID=UPI001ED86A58|nr:protein lifeguard 2-like [Ischnura elegans]
MSTSQQPPVGLVGFHNPPQGSSLQQPPVELVGFHTTPQGQQQFYPPDTAGNPSKPWGYPPQPGTYPSQPGTYPSQPGVNPPPYPGAVAVDMTGGTDKPYNAVYADPDKSLLCTENFAFSSTTIRHAFIRKVYAILTSQLLVTVGIILFFMYHQPTKMFVQHNPGLHISAIGVYIGIVIALNCCESVRRKSPGNYICLLMFTLAFSYVTGTIATFYDKEAVLIAAGNATFICLSLSIFAFQTKWDFTLLRGALYVSAVTFSEFCVHCILHKVDISTSALCCFGVLLFSVFLVYDTQRMMIGKHRFTISPEEYVFASLNLYLDIMNIFKYILKFFRK